MSYRKEFTNGHRKILNLLHDATTKVDFIADVRKIRATFDIPTDGFPIEDHEEVWVSSFYRDFGLKKRKKEFLDLIWWLCDKHKLGILKTMKNPIGFFIFYNRISLPQYYDTCALEDVNALDRYKNRFGEQLYSNETHPLALRISVGTSLRDILDFVKKNFKTEISPRIRTPKRLVSDIHNIRDRTSISWGVAEFVADNPKAGSKEIIKLMGDLKLSINHNEVSKVRKKSKK